MTKKYENIQKALRENIPSDYEVKFVCERYCGDVWYYQFAIIEFNEISAIITINYHSKYDVYERYDLWQFHNLESFFQQSVYHSVLLSIDTLNNGDAE